MPDSRHLRFSNGVEVSAREADVLALVSEHLSNAEIAERLFISVRTVESHVSSLLRKSGVPDRRALARYAAERRAGDDTPASRLPYPLTSFVGRAHERAELADAIKAHREVTAIGPGGVGKTRLALSAAADLADEFADGVWFVDLVPVSDSTMIASAVAHAIGTREEPGRSIEELLAATLSDHEALIILDNCEHLHDGVGPFIERLLTRCPRLRVLATSRMRLTVPFEWVYHVPPLSLDGGDESEAVALFLARAEAAGWVWPASSSRADVATICRKLDGMALAIELAAARCATLGLDGIAAGLSDQLHMLTGGPRGDARHSSIRQVLDMSRALLEPPDRLLLRRVSAFAAPFTARAAGEVAEFGSLAADDIPPGLARLADHSLIEVVASPTQTSYRALETIRQYGMEQLAETDELEKTRARHLHWCMTCAIDLEREATDDAWRTRFDSVADDIRSALGWAADQPSRRVEAMHLALSLARLAFARNLLGESQTRYEQAAALASGGDGPTALREAAAVAGSRKFPDEMYRLLRAAGERSIQLGDVAGGARDLASAATAAYRFGASMEISQDAVTMVLGAARRLAGTDSAARAAVALGEAAVLSDAYGSLRGSVDDDVVITLSRSERAVELARGTGDELAESAALDALCGAQSWNGEPFAAAATARSRISVLESAPDTPAGTLERVDALAIATEASLGVGDLPSARRWGKQLANHPLLAEVGHYATSRLLVADALAGNVDAALDGGVRFLGAWRRAGKPAMPFRGVALSAVAMIHGLRGDDDARASWLAMIDQDDLVPQRQHGFGAVFDTIVMLHHGQALKAVDRLTPEPRDVWRHITWIWLHWYLALKAEAAVLAGEPDGRRLIASVRQTVVGNPIATAQVDRAEAVLDGDRERLLACAEAFDAAGCRYQWARTLVLVGGDAADTGTAALTDLGLAPMPPPSLASDHDGRT